VKGKRKSLGRARIREHKKGFKGKMNEKPIVKVTFLSSQKMERIPLASEKGLTERERRKRGQSTERRKQHHPQNTMGEREANARLRGKKRGIRPRKRAKSFLSP